MLTLTKATVGDLYLEKEKAEIINGEIVRFMPTGRRPNRASGNIYLSLREHERAALGVAVTDNAGFQVDLPGRDSFSPDAAWWDGPEAELGEDMDFYPRAPVFAAEVRSKNDYGPAAEREMAAKRADYFAAGTLVVWDVDLLSECVVMVYRHDDPTPTFYRRGETAEAEPAVPGWQMPVDDLFR